MNEAGPHAPNLDELEEVVGAEPHAPNLDELEDVVGGNEEADFDAENGAAAR